MRSDLISIVLPVFNEEAGIKDTIQTLERYISQQSEKYELVFVNDGSKDKSVSIINEQQKQYHNIKLVQFARNFGHQIAITAGIRYATGDAVVVMDADLQDPPSVIPDMIQKWRARYQVVYGKRLARDGESWFKKISAKMFYRTLRRITNIDIPVDTGDFRLMDRQVVEQLKQMNEPEPFVRGMVSWVGFNQTSVTYQRHARNAGSTKYPLSKMMHLAMNGITSFSSAPLKLITTMGIISIVIGLISFLITLFIGLTTSNFTIDLMLLLTGILLSSMGIIGAYLYRIFDASRQRPLYIVAKVSDSSKS